MHEYHKIQTVWLRDPATNFKTLLEGEWARPEFEYLQGCQWTFTEKIDGTCLRVMYTRVPGVEDIGTVMFGGKTDKAQIPAFLVNKLREMFPAQRMVEVFPDGNVCLYGEGYGAKIQKGGGNYIPDGQGFILFDVWVNGIWLERKNVEDIAWQLSIPVVPIVCRGTLCEAIELVRTGFNSRVAKTRTWAEGLVMRPEVELQDRQGRRVIAKVKYKDFERG